MFQSYHTIGGNMVHKCQRACPSTNDAIGSKSRTSKLMAEMRKRLRATGIRGMFLVLEMPK